MSILTYYPIFKKYLFLLPLALINGKIYLRFTNLIVILKIHFFLKSDIHLTGLLVMLFSGLNAACGGRQK